MLKNWCLYIGLLIATFVFFLFYKMWAAWFCLVIVLIFPFVALGLCIFSAIMFKYEVIFPSLVKHGEDVSINVRIKGASSHFSFCRFNAKVTDIMEGKTSDISFSKRDNSISAIPVDTSHCGSYTYVISKISVYDIFGLFHINRKLPKRCEIVVRPVPTMPEVMPNLNGFRARRLKKSNSPHSEIYDIREYVKGDPIKSIHWKASAKKDKMLVKEAQEECFGHSRVFMQLQEDRDLLDRKLGEMLFTSTYFLNHDITHKIRILPPRKREVAFDIQSQRDLERAIFRILHMRIPKEASNAG